MCRTDFAEHHVLRASDLEKQLAVALANHSVGGGGGGGRGGGGADNTERSAGKGRQRCDTLKGVEGEEDSGVEGEEDSGVLEVPAPKITALVAALQEEWARDASQKAVIFSQFTGMLDLVQDSLKATFGHQICARLDGSMPPDKRAAEVTPLCMYVCVYVCLPRCVCCVCV